MNTRLFIVAIIALFVLALPASALDIQISNNTMAANTSADGYTVNASAFNAVGQMGFYAFDGNNGDNGWQAPSGFPQWVGQSFPQAMNLTNYTIYPFSATTYAPRDWKIKASNTGFNNPDNVTLDTQSGFSSGWSGGVGRTFNLTGSGSIAYKYIWIEITAGNGGAQAIVDELYFYGYPPPPTPPLISFNYMKGNSTWVYSANRSSTFNPSTESNASFDNDLATAWQSEAATSSTPQWVGQYIGPVAKVLTNYSVFGYSGATYNPYTWTIEGSNVGFSGPWTIIDTRSGISGWSGGVAKSFILSSTPSAYSYFRMNITQTNGGNQAVIPEIYLYGELPQAPVTNFTISNTTGAEPLFTVFNDTSSNVPTSWQYTAYSISNSTEFLIANTRNASATFTTGNYSIMLNATNSIGYNKTPLYSKWVNASAAPFIVNFVANQTTACNASYIQFTDLTTGSPETFNWTFGDTGTSALQNPVHQYIAEGNYSVSINVSRVSGGVLQFNQTTKTNYIHILAAVATFTANTTGGIDPVAVQFNDTSNCTATAWNWTTNGIQFSTVQNPVHVFNAAYPYSNYSIKLNATNDIIFNVSTQSTWINVTSNRSVTAAFSANQTTGAYPLPVLFTSSSTNNFAYIDDYYWEFGDGNTSILQNPTNIYYVAGDYNVNLRVTNTSTGLFNWQNKTAYINVTTPVLYAIYTGFSANTTSGLAPLAIKFTDTSTNFNATINSWLWNFGDGNTSLSQNPEYTYTGYGVFTVSLTTTNTSAPVTNSTSVLITTTSSVPAYTRYDFTLLEQFPITIRVKDAVTLALIDDVKVTTDESDTRIITNGIYSNSLVYGSHTFRFEKDGYATTTTSLFVASNATYTVTMTPLSGVGSQNLNVLYPHETTFTITDLYGNRLSNITVTAQITGTPIPGNWWNTLYGISTSISPVFNSTVMNSVTDDYGKVAFPMVSSAIYTMTFNGTQFGGGTITKQVTADQLAITIVLPTTSSQMPTFKSSMINATLYANSTFDPTIYLTLAYNDTSLSTTQVTFFVDFPNQTRLYQAIIPASPSTNQSFTKNYGVANVRGDAYVWGYIGNTTFGNSSKASGITMNGPSGSMIDIMTYHSGWD